MNTIENTRQECDLYMRSVIYMRKQKEAAAWSLGKKMLSLASIVWLFVGVIFEPDTHGHQASSSGILEGEQAEISAFSPPLADHCHSIGPRDLELLSLSDRPLLSTRA